MSTVAVTGATGRLGRHLVPLLAAAGRPVRTTSRRRGTADLAVDLRRATGWDDTLRGADTVVHLATTNGAGDVTMARALAAAAERAGTAHVVLLSIVGVDRIPLPYYRHKHAAELVLLGSGAPTTVLRATQFHELLDAFFHAQRRLPVRVVPDLPVQPIAARDVARRLAELVANGPAGRVADIGGPETTTWRRASEMWGTVRRSRQRGLTIGIPGAIGRAVRDGCGLVRGATYGEVSYADHLSDTSR